MNNATNSLWVCVLIISSLSCSNPKARLAKTMKDPENGLVQVKQGKTKSVTMQLLPDREVPQNTSKENNLYRIRLTLKTNEKVTGYKEMQYMNFEIRNSIYAVKGVDTLPLTIFERIPGINEKEFLYLAAFDKNGHDANDHENLFIHIDDSSAGWGQQQFEINHTILQKLNVLKY